MNIQYPLNPNALATFSAATALAPAAAIAAFPAVERRRLSDLHEYGVLDTPIETAFDELTYLAAAMAGMPMAIIALVDADRIWLKSRHGIVIEPQAPRDTSFCGYALWTENVFVVQDALLDHRFANHPYVLGEPHVRAFAGIPILSARGNRLGVLCVMDTKPGSLSASQCLALNLLARQVERMLESARTVSRAAQLQQQLQTLIVKDVKGPLSSVGTLLNLLKENHCGGEDLLRFTQLAANDFSFRMELLDCLLEWSKAVVEDRSRIAGQRSNAFLAEIMLSFAGLDAGRKFMLRAEYLCPTVTIKDADLLFLACKNILHWMGEYAQDGSLVFSGISQIGNEIMLTMRLSSGSLNMNIWESIFLVTSASVWSGNKDMPTRDLHLLLAKDLLSQAGGGFEFSSDGSSRLEVTITCYNPQ